VIGHRVNTASDAGQKCTRFTPKVWSFHNSPLHSRPAMRGEVHFAGAIRRHDSKLGGDSQ